MVPPNLPLTEPPVVADPEQPPVAPTARTSSGNLPSTSPVPVPITEPRRDKKRDSSNKTEEPWPPLGLQPDGTFIWQCGPEWLQILWGTTEDPLVLPKLAG